MPLFAKHRSEVRDHFINGVTVRSCRERGLLCTLQLGGGNELHGARNLANVLHRADASSDLALACH